MDGMAEMDGDDDSCTAFGTGLASCPNETSDTATTIPGKLKLRRINLQIIGLPLCHDTSAAFFGYDNVIEYANSNQLSYLRQSVCDRFVLTARSWVSGGMVVN